MAENVANLMTPDPTVIAQDADVRELERLLLRERVHGVPVIDPDGRVVGVVSQTDVVAWHFEIAVDGTAYYGQPTPWLGEIGAPRLRDADITRAAVSEIMTPVVLAVRATDTVDEATRFMIRKRVHRLVVLDDDFRPVGVLSAIDVLRARVGASREACAD